jgi:tetratricopeptide (TPR) repeat protein
MVKDQDVVDTPCCFQVMIYWGLPIVSEGRFSMALALRSYRLAGLLLVLAMAVFLSGCSKAYLIKTMQPIMDDLNTSVNQDIDVDMVRDAMPAFLLQMDGLIVSVPDNKLLKVRAAEAYFGYSFGFVEDTDKKRASLLYLKGRDYALSILRENGRFGQNFARQLPEFKGSLSVFSASDVPAIFWAANNWLAWIALNLDKPETMLDIPKAEAMLQRVVELDEQYYYGSAHAALGAFYAAQPKIMGDKTAKAKQHFDKAFAISGGKILFFHLMYAKFYAYQIQDRDLFVNTLEEVIATPTYRFPERAFANEVAKRKAKVLLEGVDQYF